MRMILIIVTLAVSVPPPSDWIPVDSVPEEYEYVKKQRCDCGGNYEVTGQSTGKVEDRNFDELRSTCKKCGKERAFFFDVTSLFKEYEVDRSEAAKKKAYDDLNAKYPKISARLLPELQRLLADKNPHARTWAAETIAKIGTPAAIEILLDGYIAAQPPASFLYEGALAKIGPKVLPHMEKRLRAGGEQARWNLISLAGDIRHPESRKMAEREIAQGPAANRRIACIALGRLGYKESEPALLPLLRKGAAPPDDALLWAAGRCGTKKSIPSIRPFASLATVEVRAAALVALGAIGDRDSIPELLETAQKDEDEGIRHAAIHALGLLRAGEAVPLLLDLVRKGPDPASSGFHGWPGIFSEGDDLGDSYGPAGLIEVSIGALAKIGDKRANEVFEQVLRDDRYHLYFRDAAEAAASLGWKDLVPAIIERMEKDHAKNVKLMGPTHEEFSPALRKLTGQKLGEDPKAWREWLGKRA